MAATVPFALEAPDYLPAEYVYSDSVPHAGQTYAIKTGGAAKPAVRVIYRYSNRDQYLGVTETSWLDAPIASPGKNVHYGVTYNVVGTEGKVDRVWWKKGGVLFWVSNTLSYLLSQNELLGVAESFRPVAEERQARRDPRLVSRFHEYDLAGYRCHRPGRDTALSTSLHSSSPSRTWQEGSSFGMGLCGTLKEGHRDRRSEGRSTGTDY